ncbi:MAG TPA: ribonuclease G, partial [Aliiroseovarius sp.]|nr:ribonuclease G [Aliiroseovarius sp.]
MKGRVIALDVLAGRKVAALVEDGVLEDLLVSDDTPLAPGAICRAICARPMKGQGGMMVDLPGGARGYLRKGKGLKTGAAVLVQVTGRAEDGKALPVSERVLFKSRYAIVTPGAPGINVSRRIRDEEVRVRLLEIAHEEMAQAGMDAGLILRSAADGADPGAVADDIAAMRDLAQAILADASGDTAQLLLDGPDAHHIAWRDWPEPDLMADAPGSLAEHGIDDMIATLLAPRQALKGAGFAYIEPTR